MAGAVAGELRDGPRPPRSHRAWASAVVVFVAGLILTAVAVVQIRSAARADAEARFRESADQAATAVERKVGEYFAELQGVGAFVSSVPSATDAEFKGYVEGTGMFQRLPSISGVFYLERIDARDPAAFEQFLARRRAADPDFAVNVLAPPRGDEPARYILTYYVPNNLDLQFPMGTDVTPITSVSDVLNTVGTKDRGITSSFQNDPLIEQFVEITKWPALQQLLSVDFFIGVPVYPPGVDRAAETAPIGWAAAPIAQFGDVLVAATTGQSTDLGSSVTVDLSDTGQGARADLSRVARQENGVASPERAPFSVSRTFTLYGVTFRMQQWSSADADNVPLTVPLVLVGGVVGSLLAALVVFQRVRSRARDRLLAAEMADRAKFQRDIVDSVASPMVVLDAAGVIVAANPAWTRFQHPGGGGGAEASSVGESYLGAVRSHVVSGGSALDECVAAALDDGQAASETEVAVDWEGRRRWLAVRVSPLTGERGGAVLVHEDVTDRKRSHDELEFKASRDALTGLLNRPAIEQEVATALVRAHDGGPGLSLLFIDLDDFKAVNDTYGHAAGDAVLRAVARRVQAAVRTDDRVGRLGGDEFLAVLQGVADTEVAGATADRMLRLLDQPIRFGDLELRVRASVGVATAGDDEDLTFTTFIDRADRAMYRAKQAGGDQFQRLG
ncbi:MAG: diguanylate cyclase [Acidimicrobiales bacterium]